jgi:hypothetical protein
MTRAMTFTKAQIRRAIQAAKAEGYHVRGIRPDGVVLLKSGESGSVADAQTLMQDDTAELATSWDDV